MILLSAVIVGMCLFNERPAVHTITEYQSTYCDTAINIAGDNGVEILPRNDVADTGLIFYVGAQITPDAYIPLLARIAEQGYACFIPNLSFNMAAISRSSRYACLTVLFCSAHTPTASIPIFSASYTAR